MIVWMYAVSAAWAVLGPQTVQQHSNNDGQFASSWHLLLISRGGRHRGTTVGRRRREGPRAANGADR